ncbi:hypothetical protein [Cylindrospermum sp. FACHB-282]|uniref:hypothetical protein n=1 Tax=Cylindrospermum sp. FACHB-282 TaxID=2692794 RepID=UPI0016864E53|nr:hypothetical protein [Cylindrospermum sp. FACHB-282]MBD2387682.1 hypothetical protein [Cylindrospermum sp. FACHB-282]
MSISTVIKKVSMTVAGTAFIAVGSAMPSMAVTINFDTATTTGQTWNRPEFDGSNPPTSLSVFATATPYSFQGFSVDTSGLYNFLSTSISPSGWDNATFLYQNSFNSTTPLVNVLIGNDNLSNIIGQSGFNNVFLTAGTQYFFVNTGFTNNDFGTFTFSITSSDNVTEVPEPVSILGVLIGSIYGVGLCQKYKHLMRNATKL